MHSVGQRATTANASTDPSSGKQVVDNVASAVTTATVSEPSMPPASEEASIEDTTSSSNQSTNVIPTSPQYGVAIIPSNVSVADLPTETVTISTDTVIDTTAKQDDSKDIHSTPSRNDRFKVVKIASLEPFKRGRWKCMDYVDEAPPPATAQPTKVTQSAGSITVPAGAVYLQTQSLPQQQIQQMLLQSGFANGTQFFQNVPAQMIPQAQYFYPPGANIQTQTLPQQLVNAGATGTAVPSSIPAQFINTSQPYFTTGVVQNAGFTIPQNYQNVQYVPANLMQNQNSAFVPTSQTVQLPTNFQQSQTFAGNVSAPMVNGHSYPPPQTNEQQVTSSLPTQTAKSVILNSSVQQPQPQLQSQISVAQSQSIPIQQQQQPPQYQQSNFQQVSAAANSTQPVFEPPKVVSVPTVFEQNQAPQSVSVPAVDSKTQANNVYTNPQFDAAGNSLTALENAETPAECVTEPSGEPNSENPDDLSKTNPVVNAIDNKIEQAMDLVKSHLMYTVREEVEVLKEKIAELMEKIQQLESENNFLRSQIPKGQASVAPVSTSTTTTSTTSTPPVDNSSQSQPQ